MQVFTANRYGKIARPRRAVALLIAFLYLFVGFAHNVVCADQAFAASSVSELVIVKSSADVGESGQKSTLSVCDHCPTCIPGLTPAPVFVVAPIARPAGVLAAAIPLLVDDHSRLDTPPPKNLS